MKIFSIIICIAMIVSCQNPQPAENISPVKLFTDHMVLQRQMPVNVWGTANPNGIVTVEIKNQKKTAISDVSGDWKVTLDPMEAGGPYVMKISGKDTLQINDILVGEVWIGSGQSNMEMPLAGWGQIMNYEQEIANANHPNIRLFQVKRIIGLKPQKTIPADGWMVCTPENIAEFSGIKSKNIKFNISAYILLFFSIVMHDSNCSCN